MSASSWTSSVQVAMIRAQDAPISRSAAGRSAGLVSAVPWWRRLTVPSAWYVCTTGTPRSRAASSAAVPDIQKWAWTTWGRVPRQARANCAPRSGT